jgi:HlyD family secretion protein
LRPNLNVNLDIVLEERDSVLRIPNGPAIGRGQQHEVYVLRSGQAYKTEITTGLKTESYVEVLDGLKEGDRVVLSEISSPEDIENMENH